MIQGVYTVLETIKSLLLSDPNVTTVTDGDIYDIDLAKQTLAPLSHIMIGNSSFESPVWRFNLTVIAMDLIDVSDDRTDNVNDILNTQHTVISRLLSVLNSGQLDSLFQLDGVPTVDPFREGYENGWAGQSASFDILIPNDTPSCNIPLIPADTCAPATFDLINEVGSELQTGSISSGQNATITAPNATVTNSNDTYILEVASGVTAVIEDTTVTIKDQNGVELFNESLPSGVAVSEVVDITDGDVTNSDNSNTLSVPYGDTKIIPDEDITINSNPFITKPSWKNQDIQLVDQDNNPIIPTITGSEIKVDIGGGGGSNIPVGAKLMKTGQTISYATGDDGDIQAGRDADFFTLPSVPVHLDGSPTVNLTTKRFTDELGGQTYANDIVIDWSTFDGFIVLGYYKGLQGNSDYSSAKIKADNFIIDAFMGWRLPNINEAYNLVNCDNSLSYIGNYYPFGTSLQNVYVWTSTGDIDYKYYIWFSSYLVVNKSPLTGSAISLPVRNFSVTGTSLL